MKSFVAAGVVGMALLAGCGRVGAGGGGEAGLVSPSAPSGAPTVAAAPAVPPTAVAPPAASGTAPDVTPLDDLDLDLDRDLDLERLEASLAELDRALAESEPGAEDDPAR